MKKEKSNGQRIRIVEDAIIDFWEYELNLKHQYPKIFEILRKTMVDLTYGK